MNPTPIDFEFTDVDGRTHLLQAVNVNGREWQLLATVNGRPFTRRCRDWQAVERTLRRLRVHAGGRGPETLPSEPGSASALVAGLLLVVSMFSSAAALAQGRQPDGDGIAQFVRAAEGYALMHRRQERHLPPIELNATPATIRLAMDSMAAAVRAERRDARPGDLFNPEARATIRTRIDHALRAHGLTAEDVMAAGRAEGVDARAADLHVNGTFPWAIGTAMFRCVLEALPPLPPELVYRIVGRDLVLIDIHASLIVDILPFALGERDTTSPDTAGSSPPDALWPR